MGLSKVEIREEEVGRYVILVDGENVSARIADVDVSVSPRDIPRVRLELFALPLEVHIDAAIVEASCGNCRKEVDETAGYCSACGARLVQSVQVAVPEPEPPDES